MLYRNMNSIATKFDDHDADTDSDADVDADEVTNKVDPARHPHHNFRTPAKSF